MLEGARRSIHIIDHKMSDVAIESLLRSKKADGVDVQILPPALFGGLLPHGKLILVDGKIAAFGSMSLSPLSLDFRREVAVTVDDAACVRKLGNFFRSLARGKRLLEPGKAEQFVRKEGED
jgi:phosphatidylserine/phosphatidylglycerophosphate/cardiolipin synthase-like enzyme